MNELTLQQTDTVIKFVTRQEIVYSHLRDDLIDHICCDLEDSMKRGARFEEAFRDLRSRIGKGGLREIQEDTLYAVDTKYRKMKRTMKISGVAGTVLLGIATAFKILHLPFASIMLTIGALFLVTLFLPSSLMVLWKESKSGRRLFLFIIAFLSSVFFIAGVIFKIQHWPGASALLAAGLLACIVLLIPVLVIRLVNDNERRVPVWILYTGGTSVGMYMAGFLFKTMHWPGAAFLLSVSSIMLALLVVPLYFYNRWKNEEHVSMEAIIIIAAILLFVAPTVLINLSTSKNFENLFIETSRMNNSSLDFRISRNDKLLEGINSDYGEELERLHEMTLSMLRSISDIEEGVIPGYENIIRESGTIDSRSERVLFAYGSTFLLLAPGSEKVASLKLEEQEYKNKLLELNGVERGKAIAGMFDLAGCLPPLTDSEGPEPRLAPIALIQVMEILKGSILDAESATIRNLSIQSNLLNQQ